MKTGHSTTWMVTYGSLLTAVLAFFLLLVQKAESEAESTFRLADKLKSQYYVDLLAEKERLNLSWLHIENAGQRGIKILIPSQIDNQSLFKSGGDRIEPKFIPFLSNISRLINGLNLDKVYEINQKHIAKLRKVDKDLKVKIRVEGHTDATRLMEGSEYEDNWALSTARARNVLNLIQSDLSLPSNFFSLSGYGPFHPLRDVQIVDYNL